MVVIQSEDFNKLEIGSVLQNVCSENFEKVLSFFFQQKQSFTGAVTQTFKKLCISLKSHIYLLNKIVG